ncbi:NUDIX hydrolase [Dictyobacter aurantiacus]|uniref:Nudix hydrolase domain-containing protein n=1 Tax=Dictyobacter aurantiacus TaxID=1936993 RepID=A0A401ZKS6_9CHLR|nr:NUDIX domain-containing protein [Dictyobacter aurantiacus]GCE07420.1 hypothetical protein KDAU_47490 [Dictyobacter aurantiacus]
MFEGKRRGLLFLVSPADAQPREMQARWLQALPSLKPATLDIASAEQVMLAGQDTLALCDARTAARWRKNYPDNVRHLALLQDNMTISNYVDYVLDAGDLFRQVQGIILAEQSRRRVINAQSSGRPRHSFDYTATAYVLSEDYKKVLMILKGDGRWFPPGGHIDEGEFPHEAVAREVFEETGYRVRFIHQPEGVGTRLGEAELLPVPYQVLLEDIDTHYHHDFIYLCHPEGERQHGAEFEGQWIELTRVLELPAPDDIHFTIQHLLRLFTSHT